MKYRIVAALLISAGPLGACSTNPGQPASHEPITKSADAFHTVAASHTVAARRETMLLVSLDDGSIIMQMIDSGADVCFKKNSDSATTCLTQGAPIIDPDSNAVIGFEMIEDQIDLIAKSD